MAEALQAAHRHGVIHRDIKPQNVLLTEDGEAKVADFGIARAAASSTTFTQSGGILGTPHYISPEQVMGEPASFRSDLYALGVVLYEMLTGKLPHDAETPVGIVMKHVNEPLRAPGEVNPDVPEQINAICVRLLAKDPEERYPDAAVLIDHLKRVLRSLEEDKTVEPHPDSGETEEDAAVTTLKDAGSSTVEIPDLAGKNVSQASRTLADTSLTLGEQEKVPSETVPEGEILGQTPEAGTQVKPDSPVSVTLSLGPKEKATTVPDGSDGSTEETGRALSSPGLVLPGSPTDKKGPERAEKVIPADPSAESGVASGTPTTPTVSGGRRLYPWVLWSGLLVVVLALAAFIIWRPWSDTVPVPELVGLTKNAAERRAGDDFQIEVSERKTSSEPKDTILSQDPEPGEQAQRGSTMSVIMSAGQEENIGKEKTTFVIDSGGEKVEVEAEVFDDPAEQPYAYTGRAGLDENAGIFYVYDQEQPLAFWTKDVPIPLSVAYIDSRGRIVDIQDMEALDETLHPSAKPARYALEVNRGFFEDRGIEVGDRMELPPEVR